MPRSRRPLRGSVRQSTVRVGAEQSFWSSTLFRLSALATGLLIALILVGLFWRLGWPQQIVNWAGDAGLSVTQKAQFAVKDIIVEGRQQTPKETIVEALNAGSGSPILGFNPTEAQARISQLPWVASATVERRLPGTIVVHLTERVPMARWQYDGHIVVIDTFGVSLPDARAEQFSNLPLVVGSDAPSKTPALLELLKTYPEIQRVTTAAVRVGERRWDLHLEPQIIVRLPEKDLDNALARLSQLITEKKVLERNVASIDLRLPDRLIFEPVKTTPSPAGHTKL